MKTLWVILIGLTLALAACLPQSASLPEAPAGVPASTATPTHLPVDLTPAQRAAITSLAQSLNVAPQQVTLVSTKALTWPNGCLGVQRLGVMCTQNQVPGFRITLSANGKQYEVHTNQDGTSIAPQEALQAPGPAQQAAIKKLAANLGVSEKDIKLVSSTAVEWPDSCLGTTLQGVMCSQVVTPGFLFVLEAGGKQYEYHTTQNADVIMPGSVGMDWKQEGGVAGLCEELTVFLSGEVYGADCKAGGESKTAVLSAAQRAQLDSWVSQFAMTPIDVSDPKGMTDALSRLANLYGTGTQKPDNQQEHAMYDFMQEIYHSMYP